MLCEGNTMHDMNLEKNRSKIQTAYKVSPFTKGTCPEPEDAVKRFENRYTPIPAEYRWLLLNFGGCDWRNRGFSHGKSWKKPTRFFKRLMRIT